MKNFSIVPLLFWALLITTGVLVYKSFQNNNETETYTLSVNFKNSFAGKSSKNYSYASVNGIKGVGTSRTAIQNVLAVKSNHSNSSSNTPEYSNTVGSLPSSSVTQPFSSTGQTAQMPTNEVFKQSNLENSKSEIKSTSKSSAIGINKSATAKKTSPLQKAGSKPGEPGMSSLPVGDGTGILIVFLSLFTIKKRLFLVNT